MSTIHADLTETRRYIEIEPADAPLAPETVQRAIADLHQTITARGWRAAETYPTYEFLVAATGETGETGSRSLTWYVGVHLDHESDDRDAHDDRLEATRRTLSRCLPSSYDLRTTETSYADCLDLPLDEDDTTSKSGDADAHTDPRDASPPTATTPPDAVTDGGVVDAADAAAAIRNHLTPDRQLEARRQKPPLADWEVSGLEFHGVGDRPADWQYPLKPLASFAGADDSDPAWPLARVFDGLATGDAPALVQFLVEPRPDWTRTLDDRLLDMADGHDLWRSRIFDWIVEFFFGDTDSDSDTTRNTSRRSTSTASYRRTANDTGTERTATTTDSGAATDRDHQSDSGLVPSEAERLATLETVDARNTFTVNARAVALDTDPGRADRTLRPLRNAFEPLEDDHYGVDGRLHPYGSKAANDLLERLLDRDFVADPQRRRHRIPGVPKASPAIVAAPGALAALCLTGGAALSSAARRALETTPAEKTGLELPPRSTLNRYLDADGMHVGHPLTADREPLDATVSLPPAVHPYHTAILGTSGAGKSALAHDMALGTLAATRGATIVFDSKGDGGPEIFERAYYAAHGDLEGIYEFDCEELLPALPVLSIEPQLDAGIDRLQAVETVTDRYLDVLAAHMGREAFHDAPMAVDVIEALLKALFDPIHGDDTVSQTDLVAAAKRLHRTQDPPPVSDPHLQDRLEATTANGPETFDSIMNAARRRINRVTNDDRLTPLFTYAATRPPASTRSSTPDEPDGEDSGTADSEGAKGHDPAFDFLDHLDERCAIVIDTSGYHDAPRKLLTVTLISELWTALKRRQALADPHEDLPQVNLFVEEAADVAAFDVLTDLLSKGRSFGVGVTAILQFPEQVRDDDPRVYRELLNDVGTHVTGPINDPGALASIYATGDHDADEMATRIASLDRGEWLVRPAAPFGDHRPRPFRCESRPLPAGHPDGEDPLEGRAESDFQARKTLLESRMYTEYGLDVRERAPAAATDSDADDDGATPAAGDGVEPAVPVDTTIPHTERLPDCVTYRDEPPYPLLCANCETRYPANTRGMKNAVTCCHDLASVDRDDVPITNLDVSLTATERRASDYTDAQLRLLAAVYMAHQRRFDPHLEYDLVTDSMLRLQEYVGIDRDAVDELLEDGLLKRDCTHPHRLYTVTPDGRAELRVGHREGVAHGDGKGDLSESSLHVGMIDAGCRCLQLWFVDDPDSPAVAVKRYYEVDDGRLDAAAVDEDGTVVAALEAERSNHDTREAVPADFDKMAACDPDAAIWVVKNRAGAHDVLQALNEPGDGDPRVEKTYSENMRPTDFSIDTPGLTDVYTFQNLRDELDDA